MRKCHLPIKPRLRPSGNWTCYLWQHSHFPVATQFISFYTKLYSYIYKTPLKYEIECQPKKGRPLMNFKDQKRHFRKNNSKGHFAKQSPVENRCRLVYVSRRWGSCPLYYVSRMRHDWFIWAINIRDTNNRIILILNFWVKPAIKQNRNKYNL